MDVSTLGIEEDDDQPGSLTDRTWWETNRGTPETVSLADRILALVRSVDSRFSLSYRKHYIGLARDGVVDNIVSCRPRKTHVIVEFRIPRSDELTARLEEAGLVLLEYSTRWGRYRVRLTGEEIAKHESLLLQLIARANGAEALSASRPQRRLALDRPNLPMIEHQRRHLRSRAPISGSLSESRCTIVRT